MQDGNVSLTWKSLIREPLQYHYQASFKVAITDIWETIFQWKKNYLHWRIWRERPWCIRSTPPLLGTKMFSMSWNFWGKNRSLASSSCSEPVTENPGSAPDLSYPVADPGFLRWAGANPTASYFGHFFVKTVWNWKTLDREGRRVSLVLAIANVISRVLRQWTFLYVPLRCWVVRCNWDHVMWYFWAVARVVG